MKFTYVAAICTSSLVSAISLESDALAVAQEGHWDTPKINSLIQSTTKLIRDSMKSQVSTAIQRFAEATIEKIDNDVIPSLEAQHVADQQYLATEFAKFAELNATIHAEEVAIETKSFTCSQKSKNHTDCRDVESTTQVESESCTTEKEEALREKELCEDVLTNKEEVITTLWCEQTLDKATKTSKDFFTRSKEAMQAYMRRTTECSTEIEKYDVLVTKCDTIVENVTTVTTECDSYQEQLEECACQRANLVSDLRNQYKLEWTNLTSLYIESVTWKRNASVDRIEEYTGLMIVKCLLEQVKALGLQDGPCNETHVAQVEADIKACRDEEHNTTHITFHAEDAAYLDIDAIFQQKPYPCNEDFISLYYGNLPSSAAHAACQNSWCNLELRHDHSGR